MRVAIPPLPKLVTFCEDADVGRGALLGAIFHGFPVDAVEMRKADKKAAEWRENLKKHGIVMCDGASARPPSLVPLCPSVNATTRCGVPA